MLFSKSRAQGHFWFLVSGTGSLESPMVSTSNFHLTNLFLFPRHHISTNRVAPFSAYKHAYNPQSCICSEEGQVGRPVVAFQRATGIRDSILSKPFSDLGLAVSFCET